jgi:hypothetical protein
MEAYRFNKLVYLPMPKHASTTYRNLFKNVLGWERIESWDIDWVNDHVFAHLLHPFTRHIKGTMQFIWQNKLESLLDIQGISKLIQTGVFDQHSYPLSLMFTEDELNKIDWLMIDHPFISGEDLTQALLKEYDIHIDKSIILNLGVSNKQMIDIRTRLESMIDMNNQQIRNTFIYIYQKDLNLYQQVHTHTNYPEVNRLPWSTISPLNRFNDSSTLRT